jgi:CRP/FNR family transcriptional regulator, cyclic AMP receptor protein
MPMSEIWGWVAAALTLATFSMRSMAPLRVTGIAANICFIVYGTAAGLAPVVGLHLLLLPCNLIRLAEIRREQRHARRARRELRRPKGC